MKYDLNDFKYLDDEHLNIAINNFIAEKKRDIKNLELLLVDLEKGGLDLLRKVANTYPTKRLETAFNKIATSCKLLINKEQNYICFWYNNREYNYTRYKTKYNFDTKKYYYEKTTAKTQSNNCYYSLYLGYTSDCGHILKTDDINNLIDNIKRDIAYYTENITDTKKKVKKLIKLQQKFLEQYNGFSYSIRDLTTKL